MVKEIKIGDVRLGAKNGLVLIAGPCVIESEVSVLRHAQALKKISKKLKCPLIFKSSFDKANRSSLESFRGPGIDEGLRILDRVRSEFGVPVLSDVHTAPQAGAAAEVLDCLQIPAFLCRQTDLLVAAAQTRKPINIKKGQFLAPGNMKEAVKKIEKSGNKKILLTERGTSFGYNNLVVDLRALAIMRQFGYPVIFDATHSVQLPGTHGVSSGGQRQFIEALARAAVAFGCDGLFLEVHEDPAQAPCDGPNMIALRDLERFIKIVMDFDRLGAKQYLQ